jgi:O-antigen ligase
MKTFNVYKHPAQGFEAVKVGFSWPVFFFGPIWMLVNKLWTLAGLWFGAYIVCFLIETVTEKSEQSAAQAIVSLILVVAYLALWLLPPFKGNKWREDNLLKRGYELLNTVQAETPDAAVAQLAKSA